MDFPIDTYPTNTITDPNFLYRSLGSFWTSIFQERGTLKGYTLGHAEEIIQRYYELIETINAYSVKNIDVFHKEKWKPLVVYKSKFNREPFVFEQDKAVFGVQPEEDAYYQGITFQFGFDKTPVTDVYVYDVGDEVSGVGVIAERVIDPKVTLIYGTDISLVEGSLYFNKNIFENPDIPKSAVIGENGQPVTFTDNNGNVFEEEFLILWMYNSDLDVKALYYNFGYIFQLNLTNDQYFKDLLISVFDLFVDGPTVNNIKGCCAAFLGVPIVLNAEETVEWIFSDNQFQYVVTDKECYKLDKRYTLVSSLIIGAVLHVGDVFVFNIEYFDNLIAASLQYYTPTSSSYGWWQKEGIIDGKLALSKYLFNGEYIQQLLFSTELDVITLDENGNLVFPVEGLPQDVATFHAYINSAANKEQIKEALGLTDPGDAYPTVPVNFVMENFLKANTAMLKFDFYNDPQRASFLNLLPIIRKHIPAYVYLILKITMTQPTDTYDQLNDSITITFDTGDQILNADGSNSTGEIEDLAPYYYRNVNERLFEISLLVKKNPTDELPYDYVATDEDLVDGSVVAEGRLLLVKDGKPLRPIPEGATTAQYNNLSLLDFS